MSRTSGPAAACGSCSPKHPSGSGGSGSPSGRPESTKPSHAWSTPRIARAVAISARRISAMFSQTSGRSIFGLSTLPRSPPVQVATRTCTPSDAYFAIVAAPLLDSSSGWACTAIRRSCSATGTPPGTCRTPAERRLRRWSLDTDSAILADAPDTTRRRPHPVTETHATAGTGAPVFPPGRYGRRREPRRRRPWLVALLVVVVVAAGAALSVRLYRQYGDPAYDAQVLSY